MWNKILLVFSATLLLLIAACSDSDDGQGTPPTLVATTTEASQDIDLSDAERDYLIQVSGAWSLFATKAASFRAVFSQAWPSNQRLFEALREAGAGTAWVDSLEAAQEIEPPRRFAEDHTRVLATLDEFVRIDAEVGQALDRDDLTGFVLLNAELGVAGLVSNLELDPHICEAIAPPGLDNSPCRSIEDLHGGEYGLEVEVLMLELDGRIGPRNGVWGPIWEALATEAEFFAVLEAVQPEINGTIQDVLDRLKELVAPAELTADHELLTNHLVGLLETSNRVAVAIQARDVEAYEAATMGVFEPFCSTRSTLTPSMLLIAHSHFGPGAPCP